MRAIWRTAGRRLIRDIAAIVVADCFVGMSFGAIAVAGGLPLWAVVAMSLLVFAGGAQFLAVSLVAAGNPIAAVLGGLLLNARHLPFGMAVGDVLGRGPVRLAGSHVMVDESVAFALAQSDPRKRHAAYWLTGLMLFVAWNAGGLAGAVVGGAIGDPATFGLDAAFPAGLFALVLPTLRRPRGETQARGETRPRDETRSRDEIRARGETRPRDETRASGEARDPATPWVAGAGALIAVAATPLAPAGLPVLLALAALGLAFVVPVGKACATC